MMPYWRINKRWTKVYFFASDWTNCLLCAGCLWHRKGFFLGGDTLSKRCDKTHHRLLHHLTHRKMMRKSPTMTTCRNQKHGGWHFISCQCLIKTNRVLYSYCWVILAGYQPTWRGRTTSRSIVIAESLFTVSNSCAFYTRCMSPLAHALMRQRAIAPIVHMLNLLFICLLEIFCKDNTFSRIMQSKTSAYKLFSYEHALY